jgi:hypothetical protein
MQVMGITAYEDGLPNDFLEDLFGPATGLKFGCIQLSQLCKKYHSSGVGPGLAMSDPLNNPKKENLPGPQNQFLSVLL